MVPSSTSSSSSRVLDTPKSGKMEEEQSKEVRTPKRKRPERSQESLKRRRNAARDRMRRNRQAEKELETRTQKVARLEKDRKRKRNTAEAETAIHKAARLDKVRENLEQKLAAETEEDAVVRREQGSNRKRNSRVSESSQDALERKSSDSQRKKQKRSVESSVDALERKSSNSQRMKQNYVGRPVSIAKAHSVALKRIGGTVTGFRSFRLDSIDNFEESKSPMYQFIDGTLTHLFCIGKMDQACPHCGALLWRLEMTGKGLHSLCCQQGKVSLPRFSEPPQYLKGLLDGTSTDSAFFLRNIRCFNNNLAFASLEAHVAHIPGRGPPSFKVQGMVYHKMGALCPPDPLASCFYVPLFP